MNKQKGDNANKHEDKKGLEAGFSAYILGRKYEKQNRIDNAIQKYEEAYECYIKNRVFSSCVIKNIFKNLCHLYIKKNEFAKLSALIKKRTKDILIKGDKKLDEVIKIYISLGDTTKAYDMMVDQYDCMHAVYGTNHNYLSLANLFMQARDYITSTELLKDTQIFFIKQYGKRSKKVDKMLDVCKNHTK